MNKYSKISNFGTFIKHFDRFNKHKIIDRNLQKQLFDFLPRLFNYEEEGSKLNFSILFFTDFLKNHKKLSSFIFKKILELSEDNINLYKYLKSLAPFSVNGWGIFISKEFDNKQNKTYYIFGIYKELTNINSLGLVDMLKNKYIEINKLDNHILELSNGSQNIYLHLSIVSKNIFKNKKENIKSIVNLMTKNIEEGYMKKLFIKNLNNFFLDAFEKSLGCILVIQDSNEPLDDKYFKGIELNEPIDLFTEYSNYINNCSGNTNVIQSYYSISNLLSVALNIDGIVVVDTEAKFLAYNIFIDNDVKVVNTAVVSGGARKRAVYSILNTKPKGIVGVYFQSQDGENEFKEVENG